MLIITPWYPTADRPTYGVYVRALAKATAAFANVAVLHLDGHVRPAGRALISLDEETRPGVTEGIPTFRVRWRLAPNPLPNLPMRLLAAAIAYRRINRVFAPDLLHAHVFSAGLAAAMLSRLRGLPLVVTEHSSKFLDADMPTAAIIEARIAYSVADAVLPVSDYLRRAIQKHGIQRSLTVVPNVVDTNVFRPATTQSPRGNRLLFVGALRGDDGKGLPDLLSACRLLHDRGHPVELEVLGDGPRRTGCQRIASDLHLDEWVNFRGAVTPEEVAAAMQVSDLLVAPSRTPETFCLPVAEAQACGLPSVATSVGAIPETLVDGTGVLVAPGDPHGLADAIAGALGDPSRWSRDRIVDHAERYSVDAVSSTLRAVYAQVLGLHDLRP